VRTAIVAAVRVRQLIPGALSQPGASARGTGKRCEIRKCRPLPCKGQKQYPDDHPTIHLTTVPDRWLALPRSEEET